MPTFTHIRLTADKDRSPILLPLAVTSFERDKGASYAVINGRTIRVEETM